MLEKFTVGQVYTAISSDRYKIRVVGRDGDEIQYHLIDFDRFRDKTTDLREVQRVTLDTTAVLETTRWTYSNGKPNSSFIYETFWCPCRVGDTVTDFSLFISYGHWCESSSCNICPAKDECPVSRFYPGNCGNPESCRECLRMFNADPDGEAMPGDCCTPWYGLEEWALNNI